MIARPRLRSLSLSELLDESFRLYRSNFLLLVKIAALVLVPYHLLAFLLATPAETQFQTGGSWIETVAGLAGTLSSGSNTSGWLGFVYSVVLQPLLTGMLILTIAQRYQQQPAPIARNFRLARSYLLTLLGASMLQGLIAILAAVPLLVFGCFASRAYTSIVIDNALSSFGSTGTIGSGSYLWPILLGGIAALFLLPVFVVFIRLALASQAIMLEERRAVNSIERSWTLTRDSMWRVVGFGLTVTLLTFVLQLLPASAIIFGVTLLGLDQSVVSVLQAGLNTIAEIVVTPFSLIAYTLLFFDLRIRSEGLDLDQLVAEHFIAGDYEPSPGA